MDSIYTIFIITIIALAIVGNKLYINNKVQETVKYICSMDPYRFIDIVNKYNTKYPLCFDDKTIDFVSFLLSEEKQNMSSWWSTRDSRNSFSDSIKMMSSEDYLLFEISLLLDKLDDGSKTASINGEKLINLDDYELWYKDEYGSGYKYAMTDIGRIYSKILLGIHTRLKECGKHGKCYSYKNLRNISEELYLDRMFFHNH